MYNVIVVFFETQCTTTKCVCLRVFVADYNKVTETDEFPSERERM